MPPLLPLFLSLGAHAATPVLDLVVEDRDGPAAEVTVDVSAPTTTTEVAGAASPWTLTSRTEAVDGRSRVCVAAARGPAESPGRPRVEACLDLTEGVGMATTTARGRTSLRATLRWVE